MGKAEVLSLLRDGEYVSGEEISRALGVTRAAVWKAVQALRADGCSIDSVPNRGYCLHRPESALSDAAVHALLEGCPWPINVLPTVDSTNTYAKAQAALGAEIEVPTIDGRVKLTIPEGTQPGSVFRLRGKGIPYLQSKGGGRGDQFVTITVTVPKNMTSEQKERLRAYAEAMNESVSEGRSGIFGSKKKR